MSLKMFVCKSRRSLKLQQISQLIWPYVNIKAFKRKYLFSKMARIRVMVRIRLTYPSLKKFYVQTLYSSDKEQITEVN